MSVRVMSWVWEASRAEGTPRFVLLALADCANDEGTHAYPSVETIARKCRVSVRTVQGAIKSLVALGELVVEENRGPRGVNMYRIVMTPTPADSAPPQDLHPADSAPPPRRICTTPPAESAPPPPQNLHPEPSLEPSKNQTLKPSPPPSSAIRGGEDRDTPLPGTEIVKQTRAPRQRSPEPERPDVERLCAMLADRIEANGSKRPTVTTAWRQACRLMLDQDGRTEVQVTTAIAWCQQDEFWRTNILSMPTLRRQYERLRLAAQRQSGRPAATRPSTTDQRVNAALDLAAQLREESRHATR